MGMSGSRTGARELRDQFNRLVNAQTRDDLLSQIAALQDTESGLMFFDLLGYLRGRIRQDRRYVTAAHPRVILGIQQVDTTTNRHLLEEPKQMLVLTGMLASLNTDI